MLGRRPKPVQEKRRKLSCVDTAEDEISDRMQCEINRSSCSKEMSAILRARDNWANAVLSAFLLASGHDLRVPRNRKQDRDLSTGRRQSSMIFARDAASWASFGTSHIVAPRPAKTDLSTCTRCWLRTGSTLEYLPELKRERNSRSWSDRRRWIFRLLGGRKFFHGYRYRPKQRISATTTSSNTTINRFS